MTKYAPITRYLASLAGGERRMSFREIEQVLGFPLPPAARRHRPWWSNNGNNNVMTKAWLDAGYKTEQVDMTGEVLVFRKVGASGPERTAEPAPQGLAHVPRDKSGPEGGSTPKLFGALRGTVRFAVGFDPAEPTGEIWKAEQERL